MDIESRSRSRAEWLPSRLGKAEFRGVQDASGVAEQRGAYSEHDGGVPGVCDDNRAQYRAVATGGSSRIIPPGSFRASASELEILKHKR